MQKDKNTCVSRRGAVGGQAVLEGVMMKAGSDLALAVRDIKGEIQLRRRKLTSLKDRCKPAGWPIVRGVVNFVEMMLLSVNTLTESAEMMGIEEEKPKDGKKNGKTTVMASIAGVVLGFGLAFVLFFYLPVMAGSFIRRSVENQVLVSITEGVVRIVIFLAYITLVGMLKDIRRTFEYHGAEHMSVFCYEAGEELTVENVRRHSRFHPRCGTSFLVIMMVVGIVISAFIPLNVGDFVIGRALRTVIKLLLLPLIVGIGYEFIRAAGKHDNPLTRVLSAPGMWVQRLTTKKPDDSQLEVAIAALKAALPLEYPEAASVKDAIADHTISGEPLDA